MGHDQALSVPTVVLTFVLGPFVALVPVVIAACGTAAGAVVALVAFGLWRQSPAQGSRC